MTMSELVKWFQINYPHLADDMKQSNHNAKNNEPNPYHIEDSVWTHTMMVCLMAETNKHSNIITLLAALLHDIGKPFARGELPFEAKKPIHSESNELRNQIQEREVPKSGIKVHFRGHEGISTYMSIEILNKLQKEGYITLQDKIDVLTIISIHGTLFDNIKDGQMYKENKVFSKFPLNDKGLELFGNFVTQVKNDSLGRFFYSGDGRKNDAEFLGETIFTKEQFGSYFLNLENKIKTPKQNSITLLVGPPCSGKSTWLEKNIKDEVVISRDDTLMEYAIEKEMIGTFYNCPECNGSGEIESTFDFETCETCDGYGSILIETYSDVWRNLSNEDQKNIDKKLMDKFNNAVRSKKNIIVDMTNMSRKSRRKWLNNVGDSYIKKAIVFATEFNELFQRNEKRFEDTGKNIPDYVFENMIKGFMVPMFDEIDEVSWEF